MKKTVRMLTALMCAAIIAISGSYVAEAAEARAGVCVQCGEATRILQTQTVTSFYTEYPCTENTHPSGCVVSVYRVSTQQRYYCTNCKDATSWVEISYYYTYEHVSG